MPRKTRGLVGGWLCLLSMFIVVGCGQSSLRAVSPDGRYAATLYRTDQGALGGDMFIVLHRTGIRIPYAASTTVFSAGSWYDVQISWSDSRTLQISCRDCDPRDTRDRVFQWRDVRITYPSFGESSGASQR